MHALCQLNLRELRFRPNGFEDIQLITVFIGPDSLPDDSPNGESWCLRVYENIDDLIKLEPEKTGSTIKSLPMRPETIDEDYPCWEDLSIECPEELEDDDGVKLKERK